MATDYLTKWSEARVIPEATAQQVTNFIYKDIICQYGYPNLILSDCSTHFHNQMVDKLLEKFHIKHLFSTFYHPVTNGLVK